MVGSATNGIVLSNICETRRSTLCYLEIDGVCVRCFIVIAWKHSEMEPQLWRLSNSERRSWSCKNPPDLLFNIIPDLSFIFYNNLLHSHPPSIPVFLPVIICEWGVQSFFDLIEIHMCVYVCSSVQYLHANYLFNIFYAVRILCSRVQIDW